MKCFHFGFGVRLQKNLKVTGEFALDSQIVSRRRSQGAELVVLFLKEGSSACRTSC